MRALTLRVRPRPYAAVGLIAGALVLPGRAAGQEVAGDVMIPPPREMVTSTVAASGLGGGDATVDVSTMDAHRAAIQGVLTQVRAGTMGESEAREQLGDFVVSLLIRSGVLSFGRD